MRTGEIFNAYMEGRLIMAQEILRESNRDHDLYDYKSLLDNVIKWCKLETERTECVEKSTADIRHDLQEQREYADRLYRYG